MGQRLLCCRDRLIANDNYTVGGDLVISLNVRTLPVKLIPHYESVSGVIVIE